MPVQGYLGPLLTLAIGAGVLWSNSKRQTNQVFAIASFASTLWLLFVGMAKGYGGEQPGVLGDDPVRWLRAASAVGSLFPWIIWLLKESVVRGEVSLGQLVGRSFPWICAALLLGALCYHPSFILPKTPDGGSNRGTAYTVYLAGVLVLCVVLIFQAYRELRRQSGIQRLEMQFIILNGGVACLLIVIANGISHFTKIRAFAQLSPLIIIGFYGLTVWAVTIRRVFDARQVFLTIGQRFLVIVVLTLGIYSLTPVAGILMSEPADLFVAVAISTLIALTLDRHSRSWFNLSTWQGTVAIRHAIHDVTRSEADPQKLIVELQSLLQTWGQADHAALLFDSGEVFVAGNIEFAKDRPAYRALCKLGWGTPESLQRLRPESGLIDLRQFMTEFDLGVIVSAPRSSSNPSLLVAVGTKRNGRPFTYPEVQQLQEIGESMDNVLVRSRLTLQARQSEQLATIGLIGASLAHEIRNPLVSIKTFSHLLATRFDDPEFRRRFSVLIPAEVERIDSLTQQLLDLSNPRRHQLERISLHKVVKETTELMEARAHDTKVVMTTELSATDDTIHADSSAIRQVLINLIINAFQAIEAQDGERSVVLRSRNSAAGSVVVEVADNGPGIPADQRSRLFHPFASSKTKGIGLGLAVCADILHEHKATIIVPDNGKPGATFRITFPCPPPSS